MDADTGHGDFIKETSSRKWFQRRPPDSLESASKFSKFKFFGLRKSVTEVVNIARKETTVPIRKSYNYDKLEEKSGKGNYKCKTRKENRKRTQPSRSPPLIPTCAHAIRGSKDRPCHKRIPSFGSKESLPITKGEINFTRVHDDDDSSDMLLQRQIGLPTRSALLDVEDLFGKVSTLRERLKTFEMKVRDSEAAVDGDGAIQLKVFDKPLYSNNSTSRNYRRVSMDVSALSPIKEQTHPSRTNIKSDYDEDAVAPRRKDKAHSNRSKRPPNNETQTHAERYKKESKPSKDRKPVFSKRFFQPEVPLELNEGTTEKKSERIQCSISKLKSESTATSAEYLNKDCQTQCKCVDCKSGCVRLSAGVNDNSQHILKNNYQHTRQITQQRVLNVINYDSDKDVDETDKFTETVSVHPDVHTKTKRTGSKDGSKESDGNLENNVPKIIKEQSNKYKLKQIGSNSSDSSKLNNCRCAIGRADGLFACIEDLALCAEDLQRRILLLEERTCYCPNNSKSIKEFFRQTVRNQASTSFDNVSTQVSKNYTKKYDSSPVIRSPNSNSSSGYDRGEIYMECKDPCPAYRQIGTEMNNFGVALLDRKRNDQEGCHCKDDPNNCCYGVELELTKQKQEMAEMLALMNDCMTRYRNLTDNVNNVQLTVDQFAETGDYFKPKTCDKFSCPEYVTRNLGSQTIHMKTSEMRTCGSDEICPNKPGVRIQEKVEILEQRLQKMEMAAMTESDESSTSCFGRRKKKKKKKKEEKLKAKMKKIEEKKRREENKKEEKRRKKAAKIDAKKRRKIKQVKSVETVTEPAQSCPSSTTQWTELEDQYRRTRATIVDNRPLICKCKKANLRTTQDY